MLPQSINVLPAIDSCSKPLIIVAFFTSVINSCGCSFLPARFSGPPDENLELDILLPLSDSSPETPSSPDERVSESKQSPVLLFNLRTCRFLFVSQCHVIIYGS